MNKKYHLAIQMDDYVSPVMMRMQRTYGSVIARIEQQNRRFTGVFGRVASSLTGGFKQAIQSVDQLRRGLLGLPSRIGVQVDTSSVRQARQEVERLRDAQGRLRDSWGRFMGNGGGSSRSWLSSLGFAGFGMGSLVGGYLGIQGLRMAAGQTISPAMQSERNRFTSGVMLRSSEKANALDDEYRSYAKLNPVLGYKDVQFSGTQLVGMEERLNRIMPIIRTMSDVAVGSGGGGERLKELVSILGQVKGKGQFYREEEQQLNERNINIRPYLAKALNVKQEAIPKLMQDGKIGYENLLRAFSIMTGKGGIFNNISERVGKETTEGRYQTLLEDMQQRGMDLGTKLLPALNKAMEWFNNFITQIEGPFGKAFGFLGNQMDGLNVGVKNLLVSFGIISKEGTTTEGVIKILAGTIGALGVAAKVAGDFLSGFAQFIDQIKGILRTLFNLPRDPWGAITGQYWNTSEAPATGGVTTETPEEKFRRQGRLFNRKQEDPNFDPAYTKNLIDTNNKLASGNLEYLKRVADRDARRQARRQRLGEVADPSSMLGSGDLMSGKKDKSLGDKAGLEATVSGAKSTHITVNFSGKMIEKLEMHVGSAQEGLADMESQLRDLLKRVLYSGTALDV
ncbi:tape measure protein [Spirosoma aerolatum]|uniref:tape measure protein n=1 Tax=Spirosoma aerolatum TaxID=1211326 RepID=UPI0009AE932D|nr:tape measure protein [Spirosoma aerolatum]